MKYDIIVKTCEDTLPNGFERYKFFSYSRKFTRLRNGTNKYKTRPKLIDFKEPDSGFFEIYGIITRENKKRYTIIPFID
jgi:hypothetical protein